MMKKLFLCMLTLFAFAAADAQYARGGNSEIFREKKLLRNFLPPPTFEAGMKLQINTSFKTLNWLVVILEYIPAERLDPADNKRTPRRLYQWLDDITAEMYIVIPGLGSYGNILLSGTQKISCIALDGKIHHILFAVPPSVFQRYCSLQEYNKTKAEQLPMCMIIKNKNQQPIAFVTSERDPRRAARLQNEIMKINNNFKVFKLRDGILPKEKTPWQWLETEYFDMPKSSQEAR